MFGKAGSLIGADGSGGCDSGRKVWGVSLVCGGWLGKDDGLGFPIGDPPLEKGAIAFEGVAPLGMDGDVKPAGRAANPAPPGNPDGARVADPPLAPPGKPPPPPMPPPSANILEVAAIDQDLYSVGIAMLPISCANNHSLPVLRHVD